MLKKQFQFLLFAVLVSASQFSTVFGQSSDVSKIELGAQFTLVRLLELETPIFPPNDGPVTGYRRSYQTNAGVGGRLGFNVNNSLALEGELNYFPQESGRIQRQGLQGLFGAKAGWRGSRVGVFGKARPGFFRYEEPLVCVTAPCPNRSETKFALDLGGVLELYPTKRVFTRFDVGDVLIRAQRLTGQAVSARENVFRHNLQFSAGVGFRF